MNQNVVRHYGLMAQLEIVMEESAELIELCTHLLTAWHKNAGRTEDDIAAIIEGLAHAQNAAASLCYLLYIPTSKLEQYGAGSDDKEEHALFLCHSCSLLISSCSKLLRVYGFGYRTRMLQERALTDLVRAMGCVWTGISVLREDLGISKEQLEAEIRRSDRQALAMLDHNERGGN